MSWKKPDGGSGIERYYLVWHKYAQSRYQTAGSKYVEHVPGKFNYSFTITNLHSGTTYQIQICAVNPGGYGLYKSELITTGTVYISLVILHKLYNYF